GDAAGLHKCDDVGRTPLSLVLSAPLTSSGRRILHAFVHEYGVTELDIEAAKQSENLEALALIMLHTSHKVLHPAARQLLPALRQKRVAELIEALPEEISPLLLPFVLNIPSDIKTEELIAETRAAERRQRRNAVLKKLAVVASVSLGVVALWAAVRAANQSFDRVEQSQQNAAAGLPVGRVEFTRRHTRES
ncbi:MAG: hypothetical protein MHM6MM_009205, partial [Cercozoa sp. M6MM]